MQALTIRFESQLLRFALPSEEVSVGAAFSNEISIPFPGVSRIHARWTPTAKGAVLTDLGSKNQLVVNGKRTDRAELAPGIVVHLGHAALTIEEASTGDLAAAYPIATGPKHDFSGPPTESQMRGDARSLRSAAALSFVRDLERLSARAIRHRLQALLTSARDILAVECLFTFELPQRGELSITAIAGAPDDAWLDAISAAPRDRRDAQRVIAFPAGCLAVCTHRGAGIAALFPNKPAVWEHDFLDYLALKLNGLDGNMSIDTSSAARVLAIPDGMITGTSAAMAKLLTEISATVRSRLDILLLGETGTGKELVARMIHASGPTSGGPFIAINCAAIPTELLEAELFGVHGRVATGVDPRAGRFTQAEGGTLFLDEIGELTDTLQAKLLRVLQEREVLPLGAASPRKINVRVIAASNRDLPPRASEGKFRADLYYRLKGLEFQLPPLRERKDDIIPLALHFAGETAQEYGKNVRGLSRKAMDLLMSHSWPGNVRELRSEVARAVLVCVDGSVLQKDHFNFKRTAPATIEQESPRTSSDREPAADLQTQVEAVERRAILEALSTSAGNKSLAAKLLGITRNGLALKLSRLKIG